MSTEFRFQVFPTEDLEAREIRWDKELAELHSRGLTVAGVGPDGDYPVRYDFNSDGTLTFDEWWKGNPDEPWFEVYNTVPLERYYPVETLDEDEDCGVMPENVETLAEAVVGHRIVSVEREVPPSTSYFTRDSGATITLDNGKRVILRNTDDCCAFTELKTFLLHPDKVDHVITGVGTTDGYTTWHIYADMGDVLELTVGWSSGNPFYYGYGFDISVQDILKVAPRG